MTEDNAISAPSPITAPQAQVTEKEKPSGWARVKSWVPRVIIGALIASALIAILAVITGEWGVFQTQLMYTVVLMVAFVLTSWYDADVSSKRSHRFAVTSVGLSIVLVMLGLIYIWVYPNLYPEPYICDACGSLPPGLEEQEMIARTFTIFFVECPTPCGWG
jgi:cytochrome bd-type quinol oxidase subunit 2